MSNKEHILARLRQTEERYENELGCARRNRENALIDIRSKCEHGEGFSVRYIPRADNYDVKEELVCPICGKVKNEIHSVPTLP